MLPLSLMCFDFAVPLLQRDMEQVVTELVEGRLGDGKVTINSNSLYYRSDKSSLFIDHVGDRFRHEDLGGFAQGLQALCQGSNTRR
jgi:hypothetical protein